MPRPNHTTLLADADNGTPVADIAARYHLTPGGVYAILRRERPDRPRAARRRHSEKRAMILGLVRAGVEIERVAFLCSCSKAWVYRVLSE